MMAEYPTPEPLKITHTTPDSESYDISQLGRIRRDVIVVNSKDISRAMDEIWALRMLAAHAAVSLSADLELKTYPKSRVAANKALQERLRAAAQGKKGTLKGYSYEETLSAAESADTTTLLNWPKWLSENDN